MLLLAALLLLLLSCLCDFNCLYSAAFQPPSSSTRSSSRNNYVLLLRQLPSQMPSSRSLSRFSEGRWTRSLECKHRHHHLTRKANMHDDWKLSAVAAESSSSSINEQLLSPSGPPAITARDLTCTFDGGTTYQLQAANYNLPRGRRVGLVGRNGCGKSTFLRILAEACGESWSPRRRR